MFNFLLNLVRWLGWSDTGPPQHICCAAVVLLRVRLQNISSLPRPATNHPALLHRFGLLHGDLSSAQTLQAHSANDSNGIHRDLGSRVCLFSGHGCRPRALLAAGLALVLSARGSMPVIDGDIPGFPGYKSTGENRSRCPWSLYLGLLPDSVQYTPPSASVPPNTWAQEPFSPSARIPRIDARTGKR